MISAPCRQKANPTHQQLCTENELNPILGAHPHGTNLCCARWKKNTRPSRVAFVSQPAAANFAPDTYSREAFASFVCAFARAFRTPGCSKCPEEDAICIDWARGLAIAGTLLRLTEVLARRLSTFTRHRQYEWDNHKSVHESWSAVEYSENVETFACKQFLPCKKNFVGKLNVFRCHGSQGL